VPTVIRNGTGRMNFPNGPGTPKRPPRTEVEARLSKENFSLSSGEPDTRRNIVRLAGMEGNEEE
jgi:hypothetical protein